MVSAYVTDMCASGTQAMVIPVATGTGRDGRVIRTVGYGAGRPPLVNGGLVPISLSANRVRGPSGFAVSRTEHRSFLSAFGTVPIAVGSL